MTTRIPPPRVEPNRRISAALARNRKAETQRAGFAWMERGKPFGPQAQEVPSGK